MNVMVLLLFIGVVFVTFAVGFFVWSVRTGSFQHTDRLALLPLRGETGIAADGTDREKSASVPDTDACCKGPR